MHLPDETEHCLICIAPASVGIDRPPHLAFPLTRRNCVLSLPQQDRAEPSDYLQAVRR